MHLGSLESLLAQAKAQAGQFINASEAYISTRISDFRDKRGQLNFAISKLRKNAPATNAPQALKDEYSRAMTAALDAKGKADFIGKIADQFTAVTGLGVLPVVAGLSGAALLAAIAIVGATIYTVTGAVSKYVGAAQVVSAAQASGRDPLTALQQFNAQNSGGLFGDAAKLVWPIVIVGAIYLYLERK